MSKKNIKFKLIIVFILSFALILNHSLAATSSNILNNTPDFADVGGVISNFNKNIVQNLIGLLSGAALAVFLWGLVRFIYDRSRGNDKDLARDKKGMMWGLGAMFVLVTLWGIITLVQGILEIDGDNTINLPRICTNGSCDTGRSNTPAQNGVTGTSTGGFNTTSRILESVGNIKNGEACIAGATTIGFMCDTGLSCRDKVNGGALAAGKEGICKPVGIQLNQPCLASMASESNMCAEGLSCQDANGIELRGNKQGTCKLASAANTYSCPDGSLPGWDGSCPPTTTASTKKAPGSDCKVLSGGNSNTECTEGYYCKSSTQLTGSTGKCTILP